MYDISKWKHVFKLDPNKEISDENLEKICDSGTDGIIIGGTDNVTLDNVIHLLSRVRRYNVPCALEISNIESVTPGFDFYLTPSVLNSEDKKWFMELHHQAVKEFGHLIDWDEFYMEGYCILNPESKVFQKTKSKMVHEEDVLAYAQMVEHMFRFPIFYIEYSGTYGDPSLVEKVSAKLDKTILFYGGGISTPAEAEEMAKFADVIVVGNVIYDNIKQALKTVKAVKNV